jgi:hypothetical protein
MPKRGVARRDDHNDAGRTLALERFRDANGETALI